MSQLHQKLFEDGFLQKPQADYLEKIESKQLFSVYFELRSLLYIGVLLLTTGIGFIIYLNMAQMAHLALIATMLLLEVVVIWYINKNAIPYSNTLQKPPTPYFDYVLLFGALLVLSIFSYVLIQYELLDSLLEWSSLISSLLFFYLAFRYDHRGILALAITAFAAFWGLSLSPVNWDSGELMNTFRLHNTSIAVGLTLAVTGYGLEWRNIKPHFAFTFKNFGFILFFLGITQGLFESVYWLVYAFASVVISAFVSITSWKNQDYLFFVYGVIFGYIAFTKVFIDIAESVMPWEFWLFYSTASMGGLIWMITSIISNKRKNQQL